jgi:YD repeat-containing protein
MCRVRRRFFRRPVSVVQRHRSVKSTTGHPERHPSGVSKPQISGIVIDLLSPGILTKVLRRNDFSNVDRERQMPKLTYRVVLGHGIFRITFAVLLVCLAVAKPDSATAAESNLTKVRLFDDPRITTWAHDYWDGHRDEVLNAVDTDLRSASPHPFSPQIWTTLHFNRGDLDGALATADSPLRNSLGSFPKIFREYARRDYRAIVAEFGASAANGKIVDPWALHYVAWAASNLGDIDVGLSAAWRLATNYPDFFQAALWLGYQNDDTEYHARAVTMLAEAQEDFKLSPVGRAVAQLLNNPDRNNDANHTAELAITEEFLRLAPQDSNAMSFLGQNLASDERFEEAVSAWESAQHLYPFISPVGIDSRYPDRMKALSRLGRFDDLDSLAHQLALNFSPLAHDSEPLAQRLVITALLDDGEKGESRRRLEAAIEHWPDDPGLNDAYARLELASARAAEAVPYARRAATAEPLKIDYQEHLIAALVGNAEYDEAARVYQRTLAGTPIPTTRLVHEADQVEVSTEDWVGGLHLYDQAISILPRNSMVLDNRAFFLNKVGRTEEAFQQLKARMALFAADAWSAARFREYAKAAFSPAEAQAEIDGLRNRQSWNKILWTDAAAQIDAKQAGTRRSELWAAAREANPNSAWAWEQSLDDLIQQKKWDEADRLLAQLRTIAGASRALVGVVAAEEAYLQFYRADSEKIQESMLAGALSELDAARAGMSASTYYWDSARLYRLINRPEEEASAWLQYARIRPDDDGMIFYLFSNNTEAMTKFRPKYLWHYLDRDPVSGLRLEIFAHRHGWWLGSDLGALWAYSRMKQVAPAHASKIGVEKLEAEVYGRLGNAMGEVRNYLNSTSISSSDRYIHWFDRARLSAEKGATKISFDPSRVRADILLASGETEIIEGDLKTGKPTLRQIGAAFVRARYDDDGNLISIKGGSGAQLDLAYSDNGTISEIRGSDGSVLRFSYNSAKKPVVIEYIGLGTITVAYDERNVIAKTESTAGPEVAAKIQDAFRELQDLIHPFSEKIDWNVVPDLPFADPATDNLRARYRDADDVTNQSSAGLALARRLIERLADRRSYIQEALETLQDVINQGKSASLSPASLNMAGEAIVLWHDLILTNRKEGLPADEWREWAEMRAWADTQLSHDTFAEDVAKRLRALNGSPLTRLSSAAWLPRSDLMNPGLWRHYPLAQILPGELHGAQLKVLIVRSNSDIVVGSSAGLHVLRRGFWEFFSFDLKAGRFSATASPKDGKGYDVLALAEDRDRVLWVGTASGLIALAGDYQAVAKIWRNTDQGLPSPRVEYVASLGAGVLAGGARGVRRFALAGAQPLTLPDGAADLPVSLLRPLSSPPEVIAPLAPLTEPENELDDGSSAQPQVDHINILDKEGRLLLAVPRPNEAGLGFTPDGSAYITLGEGDIVEFWPLDRTKPATRTPKLASPGAAFGVSADGRILLALLDREAVLWDAADDRVIRLPFPANVASPPVVTGVSRTGQYFVIAFPDQLLAAELQSGEVRTYTFPERYTFAGSSEDGTAAILQSGLNRLRIGLADGSVTDPRVSDRVLLGNQTGLLLVEPNGFTQQLGIAPIDDAYWSAEQRRLFILRNREILSAAWKGLGPVSEFSHLRGQQDVVFTDQIYGFGPFPMRDGQATAAVMTDQGLSLWYEAHFEHFGTFPNAEQTIGVTRLAVRGQTGAVMLTDQGIYAFERDQATVDGDGPVYDLLTLPKSGVTAIARGDRLEVVSHVKPNAVPTTLANIAATHLAQDAAGGLITNDGLTIVRYGPDLTLPRELFTARPTTNGHDVATLTLTSILVARDGAIWVTAGSSVFRWLDGMTDEFSMFIDPERCPIRSDMISRVVETIDGRIWVVASNEGHNVADGLALRGGLFEFAEDRFKRLNITDESSAWFITGYTPLDERTAIVGTADGFVSHRPDRFSTFTSLNDSSYLKVKQRQPALWLGRRGAKLGDDIWLFGTAGGVVGYRRGEWFIPTRLNWMLPDFPLHPYGARTVHAIETDAAGHIYVGTDRGLLVYDGGGGDAFAFLVTEGLEGEAFAELERQKLSEEADVILKASPPGSEARKAAETIDRLRREVELLKSDAGPGRLQLLEGQFQTAPRPPAAIETAHGKQELERLESEFRAKERTYIATLARLEGEQPALRQELEIKPLDLAATRKALSQTDWGRTTVILQYMAAPKKLYINVITPERSEIRQVDVSRDELMKRALAASRHIAAQARHIRPDAKEQTGLARILEQWLVPDFAGELGWLYDKLIRPVEPDIEGRGRVLVVPYKQLTYLPFSALIRRTEGTIEYAVQRYNIGYLPSLYLLDLMIQHAPSVETNVLAMGDPNGDLHGARLEAQHVAELTKTALPAFVGGGASIETIQTYSTQIRWLHLATHGYLDQFAPESSYLLLANKYRLGIADIVELRLGELDGAVLSGCETGIGAEGLEVATLARAFAHARVATVLATLWQVDDIASDTLMENFYREVAKPNEDVFGALAKAQRDMIGGGASELRVPGAWAAFIVLGKP